jgi:hypothetical protein
LNFAGRRFLVFPDSPNPDWQPQHPLPNDAPAVRLTGASEPSDATFTSMTGVGVPKEGA